MGEVKGGTRGDQKNTPTVLGEITQKLKPARRRKRKGTGN